MTEAWSRRQLLKGAGVAALGTAGFSLAGCSTKNVTARLVSDNTVISGIRTFVSRPDLAPPQIRLTGKLPAGPEFVFLATGVGALGQGGCMIMNRDGELVWFSPDNGTSRMDFNVQEYQGEPMITWWEGRIRAAGYGQGVGVMANSNYEVLHTVRAANGLNVDLHEFNVTPRGTVLISAYRRAKADLSSFGGPVDGWVLGGVAQEIDIATGKLVFEWDGLSHVPISETHQPFAGGQSDAPFNYFHINSVADHPDGDLLISSRNTWTVYKVSRKTGEIVWRLGGKKSDFTRGPGAEFFFQHHPRMHGTDTLTLFDNGAQPIMEKHSRALVLNFDEAKRHVSLRTECIHEGEVVLSYAMGSCQLLPDGSVFVGWGTNPFFSAFDSNGKMVADGLMTRGHPTYRAFLGDWVGKPTEPPAVAAWARKSGGTTVFASWNGSTEVRSWKVLAGSDRNSLSEVASGPWSGFETALVVRERGPYFAVQPLDAAGNVLATSAASLITFNGKPITVHKFSCGSNNCGY
jgi:hypothetical protein